jgi:hypothetical protein
MKHKMDSLKKSVPEMVKVAHKLWSYDYEDAYHQMWMHKSALRYLCLNIGERIICSSVLPFGFKPATYIFTTVNYPIVRFFKNLALKVLNYLDDWLNSASAMRTPEAFFFTHNIISLLGWVLNDEKTIFPCSALISLGFIVNALATTFEIIPAKLLRLRAMIVIMHDEQRKGNKITHKTLNRVLGYVMSNKLACPTVSLHTRCLYQIVKCEAEEGVIIITEFNIIAQLFKILKYMESNNTASLISRQSDYTITVDTSVSATGALIFESNVANGVLYPMWKGTIPLEEAQIGTSSTFREVYGLWIMLKEILQKFPSLEVIRILMDSLASVGALKKWSSSKEEINKILVKIAKLTKKKKVMLNVEWTPRDNLKEADKLSKIWETWPKLSEKSYLKILRAFPGCPVIIPPSNKIPSTIVRIQAQQSTVLVHPIWQGEKNWWPLVLSERIKVISLGKFNEVFNQHDLKLPKWNFQASLIPYKQI